MSAEPRAVADERVLANLDQVGLGDADGVDDGAGADAGAEEAPREIGERRAASVVQHLERGRRRRAARATTAERASSTAGARPPSAGRR